MLESSPESFCVLSESRDGFGDIDSCSRVPRSILVHWEKQGSDCFKLNVDGSWDQSWARAGSGGVIPDWYGNWVVGFSAFCGNFVVLLLPSCGEFSMGLGLHGGRIFQILSLNRIHRWLQRLF